MGRALWHPPGLLRRPGVQSKRAVQGSRRRRGLACALLLVLLTGCAHTPSKEERKQADAEYKVALSLVHEAQGAAREGERTRQDLKYREALESLLRAVKLDPGNPEAQYLLGFVYFIGFKRHEAAMLHLQQAIHAQKEPYPEAENLLGNILVDLNRAEEALVYYQRARTNLLYRTPYFAEEGYGWALHRLGRVDEARIHLRSALAAQPDLCGAYLKLAEVEESAGRPADALRALQDFVDRCDTERLRPALAPDLLAWAAYRIGLAHLHAGRGPEAAEAFRACQARFAGLAVAEECARSLAALADPP